MKRNRKLAVHSSDTGTSPGRLLKELRAMRTWQITGTGTEVLHRTLAGQLFIADRTPADINCQRVYSNPRVVTYREALRFIAKNTCWGRRSWTVLHHHGITEGDGK